ncbi:MAG TPA: C40 family peptidase [Acidimicrobiales bacterium]|nr:C40 family peptidase [Acidimicrobiales bacterium]
MRPRLTLPKVLAVATGSVLAAGAAASFALRAAPGAPLSAVAAGLTTSAGHGRAAGRSSPAGPARAAGAAGGLAAASAIPLSSSLDPAMPPPSAPADPQGRPVTLPEPRAGALPAVAPLAKAVSPDAVVMLGAPLTPAQMAAVPRLKGVAGVEAVDTGTVDLAGAPVVAFGVDPSTFRAYTPAASATSDRLWQYLSAGSLISSYEMARDRKLSLGQFDTVTGSFSAPVRGWMGAFASIGLPGVDLLVSKAYAPDLHLVADSGLVVSAPGLSGTALQKELASALPGAAVELLHPDQLPTTLAGNTITGSLRQRIVAAALSRQGRPYVWGAAGPGSFDCSGLVQWAYRQAGIAMPRVAAEQFLAGDHIPLADAQPGDLLFWTYDPNDPGYVDHVAIYLGHGLMVVAPHTGTDVQVTSVPTADFAGAVQVVVNGS